MFKSSLRRVLHASLIGVACTCVSKLTSANGRFPAANQLVVDPEDAEHFLLRATYGLLSSHDGGRTFSWICEDVLGDVGEADPAVAILHGGLVVVAADDHLLVSDPTGCAFTDVLANGASEFAVDVSIDPGDDSVALAVARSGDGSGDVRLLEIDGDSVTEHAIGSSLGDDLFPLTLDGAQTAPRRIYVTALSTAPASLLLRSDDRGESWQRVEIHPYEKLQAYLAAVDPNDENKLYLRVNDDPNDHLLVSTDAGDHFTEVSGLDTKLLGFALAPDGSSVAIGGPGAPVQLAATDDLEFNPASSQISALSCLKWTPAGLYACADDHSDGFTLGFSSDTGLTFAPLFHAPDLTPLACEASTTVGMTCPRVWSSVETLIGNPAEPASAAGAAASTPPAPSSSRGASCSIAAGGENGVSAWLAWLSTACSCAAIQRRRGRRRSF